jgi:hypothetical protein
LIAIHDSLCAVTHPAPHLGYAGSELVQPLAIRERSPFAAARTG